NLPVVPPNERIQHLHNPLSRCRWGEPYFGAEAAMSFWKRGSFRSESNIGSSRSNAGVIGGFAAKGASYGIESSLVKVEMERSESPMLAATRARMSSGLGPVSASFSIEITANG